MHCTTLQKLLIYKGTMGAVKCYDQPFKLSQSAPQNVAFSAYHSIGLDHTVITTDYFTDFARLPLDLNK